MRSTKISCKPGVLPLMILATLGICFISASAHYLSVSSRWLVHEADGSRAKLACVNWAGHLQPMFVEGLSKQPLHSISSTIRNFGFNCVRLTWSTYMFTNPTLGLQTVRQACASLNLQSTLRGIMIHNADLVDLTVIESFKRAVSSLGRKGILVILDNHVSKPQWCCNDHDGNGFWGDSNFDPNVWINGLSIVASTFKDYPEVVAMSLRNELRGPRQNVPDWCKYMSMGAKAVHEKNPELLIILSGLHYDTDLQFLQNHQLDLPFPNKIAYEVHWYASTYGVNFAHGNLNQACAIATSIVMNKTAFLATPNMSYTAPLFVSEFGIDQRGGNSAQNRFINCFFAFAARMDLDWSYWPLQGSYHIRSGRENDEEFFGILNARWSAPRNVSFLTRLQALQQPWQTTVDPNQRQYQSIFHPASGLCLQKGSGNTLDLGPCIDSTSKWRFTPQGRIEMVGTYLCVAAEGEEQPAKLEVTGTERNGPWSLVSAAQMQLSTTIHHSGQHDVTLCLDGSMPPSVTTRACICVQDGDCGADGEDPSSQWFVLVTTTRAAATDWTGNSMDVQPLELAGINIGQTEKSSTKMACSI